MVPRLGIFLEWELRAIELLAAEGSSLLTERAKGQGWPEAVPFDGNARLSDGEALAAAAHLAIVAAYEHLNTVVDECILIPANWLRPEGHQWTGEDFMQTRFECLRRIEVGCGLRGRFLPGWNQVDLLRDEVSALKHRVGGRRIVEREVSIDGERFPMPVMIGVHQTTEDLRNRITGVRTWMNELYRAVAVTVP